MIINPAVLPSPPQGSYGGIEQITYDVANQISKMSGFEITLVGTQGSLKPENGNLITTVNPEVEAWQENTAFNYYFQKIPEMDIIHDASHQKLVGFWLSQNKDKPEWKEKLQNVKYMANVHTVNCAPVPLEFPNVTCLSQAHADYIKARTGFDTQFVYNGIDTTKFKLMRKKAKTDRFLFVGRPNPEKGALKAVELAKKADVPLDVVAGRLKSEPIKYAVQLARDCVLGTKWTYHGQVTDERKIYFMGRAKALLFPLMWDEPFGLTVIEAQATGTPVVAYKKAAMGELIQHGKTGFLAENDEEFLKYMKEVDSLDPEECRKWVLSKFTLDAMAKGYVAKYEAIMAGNQW